jgi:predicted component of type VI protein secretion system
MLSLPLTLTLKQAPFDEHTIVAATTTPSSGGDPSTRKLSRGDMGARYDEAASSVAENLTENRCRIWPSTTGSILRVQYAA